VYSREIKEKLQKPIESGTPVQGTWTEAFEEVDLLSVQRPYPIPLPGGIKNLRIKEWESFIIQNEHFFLSAKLCNFKYFRTAMVFIYDMETKERIEFQKFIPGWVWRLPRNLKNDSVESHSYGFFFRVHTWLDTKSIQLELDIKKTIDKPAFTAHVTFDLAEAKTTPMAVNLLFSERRNMYAYKALAAVRGDLVSGGRHIQLDPSGTSGIFCEFKGYFPFRRHYAWCSAAGFNKSHQRFGFALGDSQARESYTNNENALWIDGSLTPLPPVKITRNGDESSEWIIQDMEGMVDLVFVPKELGHNTNSDCQYSLGVFNGLLLDSDGEEVPVRNTWGTGERLYLRV